MISVVRDNLQPLNTLWKLFGPAERQLRRSVLGKSGTRDGLSYGLYVPNFGKASHPGALAELASEAERSGWDGFFLWDHIIEWDQRVPLCDSFTALAAIAMNTERIRIGTTVTPA